MEQSGLEIRRIVAIAPSVRGFGFAVFEGPGVLIDWGVKNVRYEKNSRCLLQIANLFERYRPDAIIVEDCRSKKSKRCPRIKRLIREIIDLASSRIIQSYRFSRFQIIKTFSQHNASTKHQIAASIATDFTELTHLLPPLRKPWMSEDYRMGIFDAVALALTFFHFKLKLMPVSYDQDVYQSGV